ncbi:hypothetical protein GCM10009426_00990 [Rheinheimera tangshanensis]|nr:hypothetical protein GCM10010920_00830 [Rheinheimera tangshanensis]
MQITKNNDITNTVKRKKKHGRSQLRKWDFDPGGRLEALQHKDAITINKCFVKVLFTKDQVKAVNGQQNNKNSDEHQMVLIL